MNLKPMLMTTLCLLLPSQPLFAASDLSVSQHFHMPSGDPPLRAGPWKLYGEKYLFQPTTAYTGKDAQTWLQDLHEYLSGLTAELDRLFKYVESQTEEIKSPDIGFMLDIPATNGEVSRQR